MKVLLWDIDGTLICSGNAGERAIHYAMADVFGVKSSLDVIDYRGRTDRFIGYELFKYHGIESTAENLHKFLESYLDHLEQELPKTPGKTHVGVLDILHRADKDASLLQGLLTGNLRRGAELKLIFYKVWHYFSFGAFADDSPIRNELGPFALERAAAAAGHEVHPERVFIIGDTPHDIACGKAIGARTIAVATGAFSVQELSKHEPTAVFADFSNVDAFFKVIESA
jgi:phosphoglycolate phosphatase-like HAD superfamily hydrolase